MGIIVENIQHSKVAVCGMHTCKQPLLVIGRLSRHPIYIAKRQAAIIEAYG